VCFMVLCGFVAEDMTLMTWPMMSDDITVAHLWMDPIQTRLLRWAKYFSAHHLACTGCIACASPFSASTFPAI